LKVIRYRDGDSIIHETDNNTWDSQNSGAYCAYDNETGNADIYGLLYNWYTVIDSRKIAPAGWHVPSDDEWKQLEIHLGMSESEADSPEWRGTDVGGKMKTTGIEYWNNPNVGATNESGFCALPGGFRDGMGLFGSLGYNTYFWSSTKYNDRFVWGRRLNSFHSDIYRGVNSKGSGFSVRCIKDN
jgi:uncharacterized protein (TIGR02145 family)